MTDFIPVFLQKGILIPSRVFVGRLPFDVNNEELVTIFKPFGEILDCKVICDRTGLSKGFGFVTFLLEEDAQKVLKLGKLKYKGSLMNLSKAIRRQGGQFDKSNKEYVNGQRQVDLLTHNSGEYILKYQEEYGMWYAEPFNLCQHSTIPCFSMMGVVASQSQQQQPQLAPSMMPQHCPQQQIPVVTDSAYQMYYLNQLQQVPLQNEWTPYSGTWQQ